MNFKKHIIILTVLALVFAPSCASEKTSDTDTTVDFSEFLPKTEKLLFSNGEIESALIGDDENGMKKFNLINRVKEITPAIHTEKSAKAKKD